MNIDFHSRTVLVTGGGHGLGREMCRHFSSLGAQVWACDINPEALEETWGLCEGRCEVDETDVRDREAVADLVGRASEATERVDILVNNAGGVAGQVGRPLEEVSEEEWRVIFDINLTGAFNFSQATVPGMKSAGWRMISSLTSLRPFHT